MASPVSSDEGEIRDTGLEKATTSLFALDGAGVDPQDRNRSRSRASKSPSLENGSSLRDSRTVERNHSSYSNRAPRGSKRSREEDHYDRRHTDPRRFKVHYEDRPADFRRRGRVSYEDLDNGSAPLPDLRYDDRDRYADKRPRTRSRSRSPYRPSAGDDRRERAGQNQKERNRYDGYRQSERSGSHGFEKQSSRSFVDQSVSKRGEGPVPTDLSKQEAKSTKGSPQPHSESYSNGVSAEQ
jgi:serine/threonine-protein kinase PRP4